MLLPLSLRYILTSGKAKKEKDTRSYPYSSSSLIYQLLHKGEKEIVIISEGPRERLVSFLSFYLQLNGREFVLVVFVTNHQSLPRELVNIYEPYELPQRSSVGTKK
ncbi:hypothetical protein Bca4012_073680 [Brassica carinata]